jgi:hypothetical protein
MISSLFTRFQVEYMMNLLVQVTSFGIQASVPRQVCHLIGVVVAKELMGGARSCQKWGLGWECLGW